MKCMFSNYAPKYCKIMLSFFYEGLKPIENVEGNNIQAHANDVKTFYGNPGKIE